MVNDRYYDNLISSMQTVQKQQLFFQDLNSLRYVYLCPLYSRPPTETKDDYKQRVPQMEHLRQGVLNNVVYVQHLDL